MIDTQGYAAQSATSLLKPWSFQRRPPGPHELLIDILYCGVCHSDIHSARNEWQDAHYPMVPGHEIIGRVAIVGDKVTKFNVGDRVGVGPMIDSCGTCDACRKGLPQFCQPGFIEVYNSRDKHGQMTYGGYSTNVVVHEDFVVRIPDAFTDADLSKLAPLLCAGITTYSPLRHWNIGAGKNVGIVGIGGLGHLAVKFAHAVGANVIAFTTTPAKQQDAKRLGASAGILSTDAAQMKEHENSLDFIINTIPAAHDLTRYLNLLTLDGMMCLIGMPGQPHPGITASDLAARRMSLSSSIIGSINQTEEMLNFCAKNRIMADSELIAPGQINEAFERVVDKKVRYRFVIAMQRL
jgi:uncharacterized zinc-type alcohol dehydrogenase-like protein